MKINMNIERLVLKDLPSGLNDRRVIQRVVEQKLSTLLTHGTANPLSLSQQNRNQIRGRKIHLNDQMTSSRLGTQIGSSIAEGLE